MKLHIEIDMNGAAFEEDSRGEHLEVGLSIHDALMALALSFPDEQPIRDSNGNSCGRAWTTEY